MSKAANEVSRKVVTLKDRSIQLVNRYLEPIMPFFEMPGVTDIFVNRYDEIYIKEKGIDKKTEAKFKSEEEVKKAITQIANTLTQTCNEGHPILDARLPDASRVCATLSNVSPKGHGFTIRVSKPDRLTAKQILDSGSLTDEMMKYLHMATIAHQTMLVSGPTGSGKTTLLMALTDFIGNDRVLSAEDTHELRINVDNYKALESPSREREEGDMHIDMARLIKTCLRETPKRIIVGEIRDASAAAAFYEAISTGHSSWTTLHANSTFGAIRRLERLVCANTNLPYDLVKEDVRSCVNVLVHAEDVPPHSKKKVVEIAEVIDGEVKLLWKWDLVKQRHVSFTENIDNSKAVQVAKLYGETF